MVVEGDASQSAGATARGGLLVIRGSASARCAISLKGAEVVVRGSIGHAGGFLAQRGTLVVCGDAATTSSNTYESKGRRGQNGVPADDERPALRHEAAGVADGPADDNLDALHRDPATGRGAAPDHEPARPAPTRPPNWLRVAVDDHRPGHHVLGDPNSAIAPDADRSPSLFIPAQ